MNNTQTTTVETPQPMNPSQPAQEPQVAPNHKPIDLDPTLLNDWMKAGECVLIDVREPFEHAAERIEGSVSVPLSGLDPQALHERFLGKRLVFHCAAGKRSAKACERYGDAYNRSACQLAGGIEAWKNAGMPTRKPANAGLPVMRQVQITAGFLVVLGVALGLAVSPWFFGLSAFVGCGLMFAGATGWCGMAKLLAVMPWNKTTKP